MMSLDEFITNWTGKKITFDPKYPGECTAVAAQYNQDVIGAPRLWGIPIDYIKNPLPSFYSYETNYLWYIPPRGAIAIWNDKWGEGNGHCGIVTEASIMSLKTFEENNPIGSPCMIINHNYTNIAGFLVPRDQTILNLYNNLVDELRTVVNKYPKQ